MSRIELAAVVSTGQWVRRECAEARRPLPASAKAGNYPLAGSACIAGRQRKEAVGACSWAKLGLASE